MTREDAYTDNPHENATCSFDDMPEENLGDEALPAGWSPDMSEPEYWEDTLDEERVW